MLNRAWPEVSTQMYQQPDAAPGADGAQPPPNRRDGQSAGGPRAENADFEVVDEEKK